MKIGIVGLGLIGGSLAKAYKKNSDHVILGYDKAPSVVEFARIYGAVDSAMDKNNNDRGVGHTYKYDVLYDRRPPYERQQIQNIHDDFLCRCHEFLLYYDIYCIKFSCHKNL